MLGLMAGGVRAQAPTPVPPAAKPATAGQRALRLLPLGEPPPFEQEVRDGIRYELEPKAGSIPPREVMVGEGETARAIRLNLNRASETVPLPPGTAPLVLRKPASAAEPQPKPWLTLRPPETGDLLALVWRDRGKLWAEPRVLLLPDSAEVFPAGRLRIINLLPFEAALIIGTDNAVVAPGKAAIRGVAVGKDLPFHVAYRDPAGKLQRFHSSAILLNAGERGQVVIYRADGESSRRPARVMVVNETPPGSTVPAPVPP
jgi:hypothetical protein